MKEIMMAETRGAMSEGMRAGDRIMVREADLAAMGSPREVAAFDASLARWTIRNQVAAAIDEELAERMAGSFRKLMAFKHFQLSASVSAGAIVAAVRP